jgi:L-amino acid N-acyltransferase YncA
VHWTEIWWTARLRGLSLVVMTITTRTARVSDAKAIQEIYAPIVQQTAISFEESAPPVEEMAKRIAECLETHAYLVAEKGGQVVGYAYGSPHRARAAYRRSVDTTVYIAAECRRAGVGRALYGALLPQLQQRGFHAAFAGIALPNEGSVRLHEAVGFEHIGVYREVGFKFDRWHDVGWWQRRL